MFGYIRPFKPELKLCEYDLFEAVYCGLCKHLSRSFGRLSSLSLSYDFTFITILSLGLSSEPATFKDCRCTVNPLKKKKCLSSCQQLEFCASTAMLMIYYKVKDDLADSPFAGKLKTAPLLPFAAASHKKAAAAYPVMDQIISDAMQKQFQTEKELTSSLDRAADPTAMALAQICEFLSEDADQKRVLYRFGYLLGRYVYLADALDDLEKDQKSLSYNPFLYRFQKEEFSLAEMKHAAQGAINLTIGEIAPAYELLDIKHYKSILDNIIYLGLHKEIEYILNGKERNKKETKHEKSL